MGKEVYEKDPISILRGIGEVTEAKLNEVGIYTVGDYYYNKGRLNHIRDTNPAGIERLKQKLEQGLVTGMNEGTCPEEYEKIDHRKALNPFLSKYGNEWEDKISKKPALRLVRPVTDLIRHMAIMTNNALMGTKYEGKGLFFHDALSQLTERETVEWMKNNDNNINGKNLYDMWIKPELGCNNEIRMRDGTINKRFARRPVGNQPEVQPLDNSLNNDIKQAIDTQHAATYFLPQGHEKKFTLATREDAVKAMGRVHCPTYPGSAIPPSRRIKQDITKVIFALHTIMKAKGNVVKGLASREGDRAYVNNFAVDPDTSDGIELDVGENELDAEEESEANNFVCGRWFHQDTRDALQARWKEEGNSEEE